MPRFLLIFALVCTWLYFIVEASMTRNPSVLPRYAWVLLNLLLVYWLAFLPR